jgi:hypothetical protein
VLLVENSEGRKVLYDSALRKDWENLTPEALHEIESDGIQIKAEIDVIEVLNEGGIEGKKGYRGSGFQVRSSSNPKKAQKLKKLNPSINAIVTTIGITLGTCPGSQIVRTSSWDRGLPPGGL